MGLSNVVTLAKHNLGLALARDGALDAGRVAETEAIAACQAAGDKRLEGLSRHYLATIALLAGDVASAEREARAAIDLLARNPPLRTHALATFARALLAGGRTKEALDAAGEARTTMDTLGGIQEGEALVRLVHAEALHAAGDRQAAREAIARALTRLHERAARLRDEIWRRSFLHDVPEHAETIARANDWAR
jgi:tetratricopeptide (TPR) repeat protein